MAGFAIGQPIMGKFRIPVVGVVAVGALPLEMTVGSGMAGLAVREAAVIKLRIIPIIGIVAV